jgi:hypothetical protein
MINAARENEWVYFQLPAKKKQVVRNPEKVKNNGKVPNKKKENTFY